MTSTFENKIQAGLDHWLAQRAANSEKQAASGKIDAGTRGAVTGGGQFHVLAATIGDVFIENGIPAESVHAKGMNLPGFYRPTKNWDLVIIDRGILVAAIELKSQVGSFGNNFNNRTEESIGNAIDLRRAYAAGLVGNVPPWLGYVFVLEDSPKSSAPVSVAKTKFRTDPAFSGTSYQERYRLHFRRLVSEGLYDAACFVTQSQVPGTPRNEPDPSLSFDSLEQAIAERVAAVKRLNRPE